MKEYLVTSDYGQWNNIWIVLAKNAKDAINQVWEEYIVPMNEELKMDNKNSFSQWKLCYKNELHAKSLGSLHNEDGKIISVH